jgi:hypothetical protein
MQTHRESGQKAMNLKPIFGMCGKRAGQIPSSMLALDLSVTHHLSEIMPTFTYAFLPKEGRCLVQGHKTEDNNPLHHL